ncbi:AhpC/TSA family protein-like protein [Acrodontium crateriforme]|uniref:AhpC/TSA family protein-like protein n=1 Tax=Acrodontium crateriforme TaxID=150365 RepID=A0AAQ3R949_9PEZI|nr:AhpC/TSA family protein-like protein [Acrodontium crateriforme]
MAGTIITVVAFCWLSTFLLCHLPHPFHIQKQKNFSYNIQIDTMAPLKVGDKFPEGVVFEWAPITDADPTACGRPQPYDASKELKGKKFVIVSVPGAFTPGCQAFHIPPYVKNINAITSKGVDSVLVIASNDAWVMNAWGKVNGVSGEKLKFVSDTKSFFSKNHGWDAGMGDRNGRWAMVVEADGTISYAENEKSPGEVQVSSAETVLGKL